MVLALQDCCLSGIWHCITGWLVPDIQGSIVISFSRVECPVNFVSSLDIWLLTMRSQYCLQTRTPITQWHDATSQKNEYLRNSSNVFYIHGSVHRESNLITVQQDATYSVYYISVGNITNEYLPYNTHESVPTQQQEQMVVDLVNQYQKL